MSIVKKEQNKLFQEIKVYFYCYNVHNDTDTQDLTNQIQCLQKSVAGLYRELEIVKEGNRLLAKQLQEMRKPRPYVEVGYRGRG